MSERLSAWVMDVTYLLDRLNAFHGLLADALSESGARQAGAAEERRRCLAALEAERDHWPNGMPGAAGTIFGYCVDALANLPPEAARIRADKLEKMLRRFLDSSLDGVVGTKWRVMRAEARKLLGEG